jgi:hypothetical protein
LTYDGDVYERDSSLATIAGNFETLDPNSGTMIMLNINTDGTIFDLCAGAVNWMCLKWCG